MKSKNQFSICYRLIPNMFFKPSDTEYGDRLNVIHISKTSTNFRDILILYLAYNIVCMCVKINRISSVLPLPPNTEYKVFFRRVVFNTFFEIGLFGICRKILSAMKLTFVRMGTLISTIVACSVTIFVMYEPMLRRCYNLKQSLFGVFYGQREVLVHISSKIKLATMSQSMGNAIEPRLMTCLCLNWMVLM